jgi:lysozyme family protein
MARAAKCIVVLQHQLDALYPTRTKPDWIAGDAAHQARVSDHNANAAGVYQAIDIREGGGLDDRALADKLLSSHDPRIKYVISEGRIGSSYKSGGTMPWVWRPYTGLSAHASHVHLSVVNDPNLYDDVSPWVLSDDVSVHPLPVPPITSTLRQQMARTIINYEWANRPYKIATTAGGREIVGITEKNHPDWYKKVAALVGDDAALEKVAAEFYITDTNQAMQWTNDPAVEFYLRDIIANRGPKGAAIILQKAVGVTEDGAVGPITKAAALNASPSDLLSKLRAARESYDAEKYGYKPGHKYYNGLINRWNKALVDAKLFDTIAGKPDVFTDKEEPKMAETPTPAVVQVVPFYKKRTFWLAAVAGASGIIGVVTKNALSLDPAVQSMIADIAMAICGASGSGAVYTAVTSSTVTPTGAEKARNA